MSNYYQKNIPIVDDKQFENLKLGQIKRYVRDYYNLNLRHKSIINVHKGMTIQFSRKGFDHLIHSRNIGYVKIKAVIVLDKMIENAVYLNFKDKDSDDSEDVLGYFNFRCNVKIENTIHYFKIVIRLTKDGKFYYDHAVKVKK